MGQTILDGPDSIEAASQAEAVILVEEKGVSRLPEIENERMLFDKIQKTVLGCVVIS